MYSLKAKQECFYSIWIIEKGDVHRLLETFCMAKNNEAGYFAM